ncbi:MAG TPA: aminodeoxychorismate synthase component I [Steroidobacteraceae bacterium]|nr:aminodeoxychorismate synthase component I [Steroidobacteraceae bacterium]
MGARNPPVIRDLDVAPSVLRRMAARFPDRYPFLFDSAADGALSHSSILVAAPGECLWLDREGRLGADGVAPAGSGFLQALENWWLTERRPATPEYPAFCGGWSVFLSYELAAEVEPHLRLPAASLPWRAFAVRTRAALMHERASGRVYMIAEPEAAQALERIESDARSTAALAAPDPQAIRVVSLEEEVPEAYLERVVRAKEYVKAGDIYQANLSRRWRLQLSGEPDVGRLYERLCSANPAPFAALVQWRGARILSSSPERLVRIHGRRIDTRPIAGTRPRSRRPGDDHAEMRELAAHPKERAEHIMLIDLERNDLGRVCRAGTVRVDELMSIESYAHVHHIVSNVSGELRPEVTPIGALRAVFPGGTITGCPKFRCMQIIAELEAEGRGAYTGSLGYLGRDGLMDMNILIRTMTVMGRAVELRAGGGIVADSDPQRELEETRAKARGMLAAFNLNALGRADT